MNQRPIGFIICVCLTGVHVYEYMCVCACVGVCVGGYVNAGVCMCMCVYVYACVYVCAYACACAREWNVPCSQKTPPQCFESTIWPTLLISDQLRGDVNHPVK